MTATASSADWSPASRPRFGTPRRPERKTYGGSLGKIAAALGTPLMPWQQHVADVALEVDPATGRLAYRRVVLTVPRQSGKSTLMLALFMWRGIGLGPGQVMAFTAQNGLDARMRLRREWHETLKRTALATAYEPSWTTGAEALLFKNGSRLQVVAGTEKSGHGQTLDLAVVDEAFAQPDGRLEQALSPAMVTRPEPQLWYVSTAGSPTDVWFKDKVERGREDLTGDNGVAFFEWSAPADAEPNDRAAWRACMPALGYTISESVVAAECLGMAPDEFRRAYLNQWVVRGSDGAFASGWEDLADPEARPSGATAIGIATSPDRSWCAVTLAWRRPDGTPQVLLADYRPSTTWVAARVADLRSRWSGPVLLDIASRGLVPGSVEPSPGEVALSQNALADLVAAQAVRHGGEPALLTAERAAAWRPSGDTRVLDRKGSADISPLVAAALALHGLNDTSTHGGWVLAL